MTDIRLTAEEFREQIMAEYKKKQPEYLFCVAIECICGFEEQCQEELAAMDFNDCADGACKL